MRIYIKCHFLLLLKLQQSCFARFASNYFYYQLSKAFYYSYTALCIHSFKIQTFMMVFQYSIKTLTLLPDVLNCHGSTLMEKISDIMR